MALKPMISHFNVLDVMQSLASASRPGVFLAIDPGPKESAFVKGRISDDEAVILDHSILPNEHLEQLIETGSGHVSSEHLAIEWVQSYGAPVGKDVFDMIYFIGRLVKLFEEKHRSTYYETWRPTRPEVSHILCNTRNAKDAQIRQVIIDHFGPDRRKAIGLKKSPGPLYGVKYHIWDAVAVLLAVAIAREDYLCAHSGSITEKTSSP